MTDFPSVRCFEPLPSINGIPVMPLGKESSASPIPAAWSSSLLLDSFYTTHVQKYGLAAFPPPRLFTSSLVYRGFYTQHHRADFHPASTLHPVHNSIINEINQTLADLNARRSLWSQLRPWYPLAHARWLQTPYSNTAARAIIARFTAVTDPSRRLTEDAARLAENEAHAAQSGMYYFTWLYQPTQHDKPNPARDWVFTVLALMMQAVLPARLEGVGLEYPSRMVDNTWFPSRAATQARNDTWRFARQRTVYPQLRKVFELGKRHHEPYVRRNENGEVVEYVRNRTRLLLRAMEVKQHWERLVPIPRSLAEAVDMELRALLDQDGFGMDEEWLDWGFVFPEYSEELVSTGRQGMSVPWVGVGQGGGAPSGGGPAQGHAHMAQIVGRGKGGSKGRVKQPRTGYFTVSEVGEKISDERTGPNWALLSDDQGGYDVFDVSGEFFPPFTVALANHLHHAGPDILKNEPGLDLETVFEMTELGRQIVSKQVVEALKARSQHPLGKLLTWKRPEEVAEHDGQDGRDLWCVIGNLVYDITGKFAPIPHADSAIDNTDFHFRSEAEKGALIALATGKKSPAAALEGLDVANLLGRLAPHKCGYLRQAAGLPPGERPFTLRELGRHIYPEVGMYCAVDGAVLDLGRES
jgi:hypothetical protein